MQQAAASRGRCWIASAAILCVVCAREGGAKQCIEQILGKRWCPEFDWPVFACGIRHHRTKVGYVVSPNHRRFAAAAPCVPRPFVRR